VAVAHELSVALHRRASLATWCVSGADRVDYLHRMLTQEVRALPIGQAAYACLLTVKGRILGDLLLWNVGPHLLLELEAAAVPAVMPALERYVIADDVAFQDITALGVRYALAGPEAHATLTRAGFDAPLQAAFLEVECGGHPGRILRFDRRGLVTFEIAVAPQAAAALEERLALTPGTAPFAAACVAHGIPRFGHELGPDVLFNEAGLEEAVAWGKGCFPGQEPVVMARHRGRPPRLLVRLACESGAAPTPGAEVRADGGVVGHVTSSAAGVALAYVKHALAQDGAVFEVEGGGRARATLPGEA
jgi:folate-binding protein YgfZ